MKHILVVDDEPAICRSLAYILKTGGYSVSCMHDPQSVLDCFSEKGNRDRFDLLITDVQMPQMTGLDLIDRLNERKLDLPTMVITGYNEKDWVVSALRKGCYEFLDKPLEYEVVLDSVDRVFKKVEQEKAKEVRALRQNLDIKREIDEVKKDYEMISRQFEVARETHSQILSLDKVDHGDIAVAYKQKSPYQLGGDFFNISQTDRGYGLLLADVAGHDMGASYHTVMIKTVFDGNVRTSPDGEQLLTTLNDMLYDRGRNQRLVTALYLDLDMTAREATAFSAGHPPVMVTDRSSSTVKVLSMSGDILGLHENVELDRKTFAIEPNDKIFLYTDGIIEMARVDGKTGASDVLMLDGLTSCIQRHHEQCVEAAIDCIWRDLMQYCRYKIHDDMLIAAIEIK